MKVTIQQVQRGLINYIDQEIAQKAIGKTKFITYFVMPQVSSKVANFIVNNKDNDMMKDFMDENGNIELDKVYSQAKEAIQKSGQFEMYNIIFNETDIDKLYGYIKQTIV